MVARPLSDQLEKKETIHDDCRHNISSDDGSNTTELSIGDTEFNRAVHSQHGGTIFDSDRNFYSRDRDCYGKVFVVCTIKLSEIGDYENCLCKRGFARGLKVLQIQCRG